ncbi:hypothetical protein [Ruicaihuangia caeni]|uniref:Uncharacterized protein n=1 Tax=Ruicaihuangia caeni TaxID=3042517 RepID=A0AAW6TEB7_9MICO|nr:hypothetical protein [Klugiella sp. YN-L-19]MDI2099765.1 hypothetical protein [Klugiella sp. YN-L-19]
MITYVTAAQAMAAAAIAMLTLVGAVVMVAFASRRDRQRLAVVAVAVVATWIVWSLLGGLHGAHPLYLVVAGILLTALAVVGGNPVVGLVLRFATVDSRPGEHGGIIVGDDAHAPREVLRGGTTIGFLERFALVGSVLAGQFGGIAVVVAVKGLARYSEFQHPEARERFIIGTLTSFIWAVACAAPLAIPAIMP